MANGIGNYMSSPSEGDGSATQLDLRKARGFSFRRPRRLVDFCAPGSSGYENSDLKVEVVTLGYENSDLKAPGKAVCELRTSRTAGRVDSASPE